MNKMLKEDCCVSLIYTYILYNICQDEELHNLHRDPVYLISVQREQDQMSKLLHPKSSKK